MLKSKVGFGIISMFLLMACGNQDVVENTSVVEIEDSISEDKDEHFMINDSEKKIPIYDLTEMEFPLNIDTAFIESHDNQSNTSNLSGGEVKNMSMNLINKRGDLEVNYVIRDFLMIDSLKSNNAYDEYLSNLDIGMTKNANANSLGHINLNNGGSIVIWSVQFTTIEACPFYAGTQVYATFSIDYPDYLNTILVGEISGGGDAPYWTDVTITSVISNSSVEVKMNQNSGGDYDENDEEIVDVVHEKYSFTISENGFSPSK
jgi:hypothetical protein